MVRMYDPPVAFARAHFTKLLHMGLEDGAHRPDARATLKSRLLGAPNLDELLQGVALLCAEEVAAEFEAPHTFAQRCDQPLAPHVSWYRRHRADGAAAASLDAFLVAHPDATRLPTGKIRCETTGHELAPQLPALQGHWAGKVYRKQTQLNGKRKHPS